MSTQRTKMLAGIAALALVAGTSLVSAQEKPDQNVSPQAKQPQSMQQMNKTAPAGKMGQGQASKAMGASDTAKSAQMHEENATQKNATRMNDKNKAASESNAVTRNRTAQSEQHKFGAKHHAMTRTEQSKGRRTAEERSRMRRERNSMAQEHGRNARQEHTARSEGNGLKGLQGNASGMNVQLSNEQRDRIRTTVIHGRNAPRAGNVNFDVTVGTTIPHGFHVVPVPGTLVQIEPRWRGFLYFVWMDDVVIVNPRNMRIVAVVPA